MTYPVTSRRVKLLVDLTKYDSRLTGGQEGWTVSTSNLGDCFVFTRFDCGAALDILWRSLEVDETGIVRPEDADAELVNAARDWLDFTSCRIGDRLPIRGAEPLVARLRAALSRYRLVPAVAAKEDRRGKPR